MVKVSSIVEEKDMRSDDGTSQRHPDASAIDCWRKRSWFWWRVLWPSSGSHVPRKNHKYVFRNTYQQIFQISPQALHVQAVHQWGVQRNLGYRLKVSSRRGDSYNCLLQYQRQLPSTRYFSQIRLWVQSERCITLFVMWIELSCLITNRMHAQDLYRECDREKRRCLDSLWMPLKRDFALQESWDQYYL